MIVYFSLNAVSVYSLSSVNETRDCDMFTEDVEVTDLCCSVLWVCVCEWVTCWESSDMIMISK